MTIQQWIIFATLLFTLILFISGRWRYDIVALLALIVVTLTGLIPLERAFTGFSNPAVITVAAVLVVSRGLQNSGIVDLIGQRLSHMGTHVLLQLAALCTLVAVFSAFMNNVGALALLLPVAIQMARKHDIPPSLLLMPLAFSSLLGGMTTLIGTPPNIIVASFRAEAGGEPFRMFDFSPVGVGVALAGLLFIVLIGWRLIPIRRGQPSKDELFEIDEYITEVRVPEDSRLVGKRLRELNAIGDNEVVIVGLVRGEVRRPAPSPNIKYRADDILIIKADSEELEKLMAEAGLELAGSDKAGDEELKSDDVSVIEVVVMPNSIMERETARSLDLRRRFRVNLLAIARQGGSLRARLDRIRLRVGDVLLLQGQTELLGEMLGSLGCLPLAERGLRIGQPRRILISGGIFAAALVAAAAGLLPVQIAFLMSAVALTIVSQLSLREAYTSIDWPIIILLGAMIPVGEALETTGGAQLLADGLLQLAGQMPAAATLVVVLVGTMFLSDLVNNAAAVVLMAPIAISVARGVGASVDPYLMAVAVGASCAFLTPIGHQSNTLVMGPGGYKFGDYWRMGLPLEIIIVVVAIPLILVIWPLGV